MHFFSVRLRLENTLEHILVSYTAAVILEKEVTHHETEKNQFSKEESRRCNAMPIVHCIVYPCYRITMLSISWVVVL